MRFSLNELSLMVFKYLIILVIEGLIDKSVKGGSNLVRILQCIYRCIFTMFIKKIIIKSKIIDFIFT